MKHFRASPKIALIYYNVADPFPTSSVLQHAILGLSAQLRIEIKTRAVKQPLEEVI